MDTSLFIENITSPALLFFILGIIAVQVKSDLEIPKTSAKFISMYLLFAIGFKGGQELIHEEFGMELLSVVSLAIGSSILIPIYTFHLLKKKFSIENSSAIAAAYGSISAVTFITTVNFLTNSQIEFSGHMVAIMALMEAPAIIVGLSLLKRFNKDSIDKAGKSSLIHSLTNGSVFLLLGSLIIGMIVSDNQAEGIKPFTNDLFVGFLAIFLLDMGIQSGRHLKSLFQYGIYPFLFAIIIPFLNGILTLFIGKLFIENYADILLISMLVASASYIAVPAAMKVSNPKASPGLYLPMALAVSFPFNITVSMPLFFIILQ